MKKAFQEFLKVCRKISFCGPDDYLFLELTSGPKGEATGKNPCASFELFSDELPSTTAKCDRLLLRVRVSDPMMHLPFLEYQVTPNDVRWLAHFLLRRVAQLAPEPMPVPHRFYPAQQVSK